MKPYYYSLNEYLKEEYGEKLYKLALNGGMTCPNRDGLIGSRGCIFCSQEGSGDFAGNRVAGKFAESSISANVSLDCQIAAAKKLISAKYKNDKYIAYFQSYTNTYAPIDYLRELFYSVINRDDISILSVATRPDCLSTEVIELLNELNHIKPVWVELGLQTIHQTTAEYIRRGYSLEVYDQAVKNLLAVNISPIVHMILGLPKENEDMMVETAAYIAKSGARGIKLQLLHVLSDTDLYEDYKNGLFSTLSLNKYCRILGKIINILPPDMVIHRLTGDGPKNILVAPLWSLDKKNVINSINRYFKENNIIQGRYYK